MKYTTNKPIRSAWRFLQYLVLVVLVSSCGEYGGKNAKPCTNDSGHKWEKWEQVETPKDYRAGWICFQRSCEHCGYIQGDSTRL